jgi:hypothetical protein
MPDASAMSRTDPAYILPSYPPLLDARDQLAKRFAVWCNDGASEAAAFAEIEAIIRALSSACATRREGSR